MGRQRRSAGGGGGWLLRALAAILLFGPACNLLGWAVFSARALGRADPASGAWQTLATLLPYYTAALGAVPAAIVLRLPDAAPLVPAALVLWLLARRHPAGSPARRRTGIGFAFLYLAWVTVVQFVLSPG